MANQYDDKYWREQYRKEPYYRSTYEFSDYDPAYRYGYESFTKHKGRAWNEVERDLETGWDRTKGTSRLTWQDAKDAVRAAWHRVERALPGDADRDRR